MTNSVAKFIFLCFLFCFLSDWHSCYLCPLLLRLPCLSSVPSARWDSLLVLCFTRCFCLLPSPAVLAPLLLPAAHCPLLLLLLPAPAASLCSPGALCCRRIAPEARQPRSAVEIELMEALQFWPFFKHFSAHFFVHFASMRIVCQLWQSSSSDASSSNNNSTRHRCHCRVCLKLSSNGKCGRWWWPPLPPFPSPSLSSCAANSHYASVIISQRGMRRENSIDR